MARYPMIIGVICLGLLPLCPISAQESQLEIRKRVVVKGAGSPIVFTPNDKRLVQATVGYKVLTKYDVMTGKETESIKGEKKTEGSSLTTALALSPDFKTMAVASSGGGNPVALWDVATSKKHATLTGHSAPAERLAFSPDGQTLASASRDRTVRLWDITSGKELATLKGHGERVSAVAFSADRKHVVRTRAGTSSTDWCCTL